MAASGLWLVFWAFILAAPSAQADFEPGAQAQEFPLQASENVVTIFGGTLGSSSLEVARDIADVVYKTSGLRVLPVVGRGPAEALNDVLLLQGADLAITHANLLNDYARNGTLGLNPVDEITYVAKLFNEELHLLVRDEISEIGQLSGQVVSLGEKGGSAITGQAVFDALNLKVESVHLPDAEALLQLQSGKIAGALILAGKPSPFLATLHKEQGIKLLSIPYTETLDSEYYPAFLAHQDYPQLLAEHETLDTIAVCAVLVARRQMEVSPRSPQLAKFVQALLDNSNEFLRPYRHPKWREVNFTATLEGWRRAPSAQFWIESMAAQEAPVRDRNDVLARQAPIAGLPVTDEERDKLFQAFLEWGLAQGLLAGEADQVSPPAETLR